MAKSSHGKVLSLFEKYLSLEKDGGIQLQKNMVAKNAKKTYSYIN